MKKLLLLIIIILTSSHLRSEEISFTQQFNLIDDNKIELLDNQYYGYLNNLHAYCTNGEEDKKRNHEEIINFHVDTFKKVLNFESEHNTGCRSMWGVDLPLSTKEEYCNKKTINDLEKYKPYISFGNEANILLDYMFLGGRKVNNSHTQTDKLKKSLEFVQTNLIKKLKSLKNKRKIFQAMAHFEILVSEILKIPYYKIESLNELLLARDVFRKILNIPIHASTYHAAHYFYYYGISNINTNNCDTREYFSYRAINFLYDGYKKKSSLRKFYYLMALKYDHKSTLNLKDQLQANNQKTLKKETDLISKELKKNLNESIDLPIKEISNQINSNLESITKNSREIFSAFDHWGDLGPTIDLGNGRGLNLLTGRVGRYKRFGE